MASDSTPLTPDELSANHWNQRYLDQQTGWDRGQASPALDYFLTQTSLTKGRVLVPGCGRGHEVLALANKGFNVTGLDFAPEPVDHLRQQLETQNINASVMQGDVLHARFDEPFDAIYEQTCLCALHPDHWNQYQQQLHTWLKPAGQLWAVFMQSDKHHGPPYHCNLESMKKLFHPSFWTWRTEPKKIKHPSGLHELAVVLEKIAS